MKRENTRRQIGSLNNLATVITLFHICSEREIKPYRVYYILGRECLAVSGFKLEFRKGDVMNTLDLIKGTPKTSN